MEESIVNISPFLDVEGRITVLPKKRIKRAAVLEYLSQKFELGQDYTEKEINELCLTWHTFDDYFLVRRSLIEAGLLRREPDGSRYWREEPIAVKKAR